MGGRRRGARAVGLGLAAAALTTTLALGATGDPDAGYGAGGLSIVAVGNSGRSSAEAVVAQGDRVVLAGQALADTGAGQETRLAITRLNADGTRDGSFGAGGETLVAAGDAGTAGADAVALAPDGRIVAAGSALVGGQQQVAVARFSADGQPDGGFGSGGVALFPVGDGGNAIAHGVVVGADGRVVVAGEALDGGVTKAFTARLGPAGAPEAWGALISAGNGTDTRAAALAQLADGSFAIAGQAAAADGATRLLAARVSLAGGRLTDGWGTNGNGVSLRALGDGGSAAATSVAPAGTGLVVGGSAADGGRTKLLVARFTGAGQPDKGFGGDGATLTEAGSGGTAGVGGVAVTADGHVLVGGSATDDQNGSAVSQMLAARYTAGGDLDAAFSPTGRPRGTSLLSAQGQPAFGMSLGVQGDGKLVVGGRVGEGDGETLAAGRFCVTEDCTGAPGTGGGGTGGQNGEPFDCGSVVAFSIIQAEGCVKKVEGRYEATSRLLVNGLILQPEAGSTLVLDPGKRRLYIRGKGGGAGQLTARVGSITIFENLPLDVSLPSGATRALVPDLSLSARGSLFGFPFRGRGDLTLVKGGVEVAVQVSLPKIFGGVTGTSILRADMRDGLQADGLRITAREAQIGPLIVRNLLIAYRASDRLWEGQATIYLVPIQYGAEAGVAVQDGKLQAARAGVDGLNLSVGPGVFLQRIAFGIGADPFTIMGGVGFTAGTQVGGVSAVRVDGNFRLSFPGSPFARLEIASDVFCLTAKCVPGAEQLGGDGLSVFNIPLAGYRFSADTDGQVEFSGQIGYDVKIANADAQLEGWLDGTRAFNAEGSGTACVFAIACAGAEAVISSEGMAACGYVRVLTERVAIGFGVHWPSNLSVMALACDLGPYRAVRDVRALGAFAAQAGPQKAHFPAGLSYGLIRLRGATGPPLVEVTAAGDTVATPSGPEPGVRQGRFMVFKDPGRRETIVVVARPGTDVTITPQSGSPAIEAVEQAQPLPPVSVRASVAGRGRSRTLRYRIRAISGQLVRFAEVGGGVTRLIGKARGTRGTLRFRPADGRAGRRAIVAQVVENGLPRATKTVAHYRAPARLLPGRVRHLRARRAGTTVMVSWAAARGGARPAQYRTTVSVSDGRRLLFTGSRRRVVVPGVRGTDRLTVRVAGETASGHAGRRASLRVKAARR